MSTARNNGPGHGPWHGREHEHHPSTSALTIPDEQTPLIGNATSPYPKPYDDGSSDGDDDDDDDDEDIDPDDFDLLLTRSSSYATGLLGPEPNETPLLRGDRKYSTSSRAGRPPPFSSRRPSGSSEAIEVEVAAELERAGQGELEAAAADKSPFLGGISHGRFWWIFGNVLALHFVSCFDGTIMASSHPVITSYFQSSNSASWLSTAFLLTSTAFQPLLGRLSDTVGRKGPYIVTGTIFALATLWCALAQSMTSFIAARAVCGIGAGGVMTLGSIIISDLVPIERRGGEYSRAARSRALPVETGRVPSADCYHRVQPTSPISTLFTVSPRHPAPLWAASWPKTSAGAPSLVSKCPRCSSASVSRSSRSQVISV